MHMSKALRVRTAWLIAVLAFACSGLASEIALVKRVRGLVSAEMRGESGPAVIGRGHLIMPGTLIQTGSRGYAEIVFLHSMSAVFLRPGSAALLHASRDSVLTTELITIESGEIYIEANKTPRSSFDVGLPAGLATLGNARCLFIIPSHSSQTALFNLQGACRITDHNYSQWRSVSAPGAAFVHEQTSRIQTSALSPAELPNMREFVRSTQSFSSIRSLAHSLNIKRPPSGTVQPFGALTILSGAPLSITAAAEEGMRFSRWHVLEGNAVIESPAAESTFVRIASDAVIEPLFAANPNILAVQPGQNGSVSPAGEIALDDGGTITVRAVADSLYRFAGWKKGGGVQVEPPGGDSAVVKLERASGRIMPLFERIQDTIRVRPVEGGRIEPDSIVVVDRGSDTLFMALPDSGFAFIRWSLQGAGRIDSVWNRVTRIRPEESCTVQALIAPLANTIALTIENAPHVRVTPGPTIRAVKNWLVPLEVDVDSGYQVDRWEIAQGRAKVKYKHGWRIQSRTDAAVRPVAGVRKHTLHVTAGHGGDVRPAGAIEAGHGTPLSLIATPDKRNTFVRWRVTGGAAKIADPLSARTEIVLDLTDAAVRAEFSPAVCSLFVSAASGGYTLPAGAVRMSAGEELILQAIPKPKAAFLGWRFAGDSGVTVIDSLSSSELAIVANGGKSASLHAEFSTETVELIILKDGMGAVTPGQKTYIVKNRWHTIEATPNSGQSFVQWTAVSPPDLSFKDKTARTTQINPGNQNCIIKPLYSPGQGGITSGAGATPPDSPDSAMVLIAFVYNQQEGMVTPAGPLNRAVGDVIQADATALRGYRFTEWNVLEGAVAVSDRFAAQTMMTVQSGPVKIAARFEAKPINTLEVRFMHENGSRKSVMVRYR